MLVSVRDGLKMIGVMLILACAAFVSTLFLTYRLDLTALADEIEPGVMQMIYDAQLASSNVVLAVTAGCLLATSTVVLCFYVSSFIERRSRELGVLKALGYGEWELALRFWVFGLSALAGCAAGTLGAYLYLPVFVDAMNADGLLPGLTVHVHPELLWLTAAAPAALMAAFAVLAAHRALKKPALTLLRGGEAARIRRSDLGDVPFLAALRRSIRSTKKSLLFFTFIGGFCFACMMQMAPSMHELASDSMGLMMFIIGLVLSFTALIISAKSAVRSRIQTLAMMHAVGYSQRERTRSVLGIYRPFAYAGFAVGTLYQYFLLRLMVDVFYKDFPDMPAYSFDTPVFFWVLIIFAVVYELCTVTSAAEARRMPLRVLMSD